MLQKLQDTQYFGKKLKTKKMKPFTFILIMLINIAKVTGQVKDNQYEKLEIKNKYSIIKTLVNDKRIENEDDNVLQSYSIIYNSKKDSVVYYGLDNSFPILFVLKTEKKANNVKFLIVENKKTVDSLNIVFYSQKNKIEINKDQYYFNSGYYLFLKKNILQLKNIADLVDLLDDMLGDYPYQMSYLRDFSSNNKYRLNNNRILKADIVTFRNQVSDYKDDWEVNYLYNSKNILSSVIKKSNEEVQFKKELIKSDGLEYEYRLFRNVENRFEDNDIIKFNLKKNTYEEYNKHFQFGLLKEISTKLKRVFYKKEKVKKYNLL
ncbi:hypothetical protein B0A64_09775 [Flavobacterium araucananum]|uniref:Uncharacterized protein n=2 Tax=Flavobacterium araucananum TaxID=946678 RepID=A0A227PBE4_9FLAO|nr:hypothetical protein B0A64_09775 [Flavobacterium araucananum]